MTGHPQVEPNGRVVRATEYLFRLLRKPIQLGCQAVALPPGHLKLGSHALTLICARRGQTLALRSFGRLLSAQVTLTR